MDKSSRQERSNPSSRESLLAAKLKSTHCGNFLECLWGQHSFKANVIVCMYLGKYAQYLLFQLLLTYGVLKQQYANLRYHKLESTGYYSALLVRQWAV